MRASFDTISWRRRSVVAVCSLILATAAGCDGGGDGDGGAGGAGGIGGTGGGDTGPVCSDGVIEGGEQCDGTELSGMTCADGGYDSGDLACANDCTFDLGGCTGGTPAVCGDDTRGGLESCDGGDLDGSSCAVLAGFDGGTLGCTGTCVYDTSACTTSSATGGTGGDGGGGGAGGTSIYPDFCTVEGLEFTRETVMDGSPNTYTYRAYSSREEPYDIFILNSYMFDPYNGPTGPGTYSLLGVNNDDCGLCLLGYRDCTAADGCGKSFFASAGNVVIHSFGNELLKFNAELEDVFLREVEIDPEDRHSVPVSGGDIWCTHETSIQVGRLPTKATCVADGTGNDIGENIEDFGLQDCNGKVVNLHESCNEVKAMQIILVAGWCSACTAELTVAYPEATADPDLGLWIVLGEDDYGEAPDLAYCNAYAAGHDLPASQVLLDPAWRRTWSYINPHISESFYLPWYAVLDGDNMEYVYCDDCAVSASKAQTVNALLND